MPVLFWSSSNTVTMSSRTSIRTKTVCRVQVYHVTFSAINTVIHYMHTDAYVGMRAHTTHHTHTRSCSIKLHTFVVRHPIKYMHAMHTHSVVNWTTGKDFNDSAS